MALSEKHFSHQDHAKGSILRDTGPRSQGSQGRQGLLDRLSDKRVIFCLGPGGVGKTTFSAALATSLAIQQHRTLVCTLDPARRLAQALGIGHRGFRPTPVPAEGLSSAGLPRTLPLHTAVLDVTGTMDRTLAHECRDESLRQAIESNVFYRMLVEDLEGSQMYAALAQLQDLAEDEQWEHIVVDTPPTAHLQDLLVAPYRMTRAVHSPFLRWLASSQTWSGRAGLAVLSLGRRRLLRKAASVVGGTFLEQLSQFIGLISDMLPMLEQRADRAESLLRASDTSYVIVTVPNPDRVYETKALSEELLAQGMNLLGLVINRVSPFSQDSAALDLKAWKRSEDSSGCLKRLGRFGETVARTERRALSELQAAFVGLPLVTIPLLSEDMTGLSEVAKIVDIFDNCGQA